MKLLISLVTSFLLTTPLAIKAATAAPQDVLAHSLPSIGLNQPAFGNVQCPGLIRPTRVLFRRAALVLDPNRACIAADLGPYVNAP